MQTGWTQVTEGRKALKKRHRRIHYGRLFVVLAVFGGLTAGVLWGTVRAVTVLQRGGSLREILGENTAQAYPLDHSEEVAAVKAGNALDKVRVTNFSDEELRSLFYTSPLTEEQIQKMQGTTLSDTNAYTSADDLSYVRVLYRDFNGDSRIGELAVSKEIAEEMADIFYDLYIHQYPIGKMTLADGYAGSENSNMEANNTFGLLIDDPADPEKNALNTGWSVYINPLYNPKVTELDNNVKVTPEAGYPYISRTVMKEHMINKDDYAYKLFTSKGYRWGGDSKATQSYGVFWKENPEIEKEKRRQQEAAEKAEKSAAESAAHPDSHTSDSVPDDSEQDAPENGDAEYSDSDALDENPDSIQDPSADSADSIDMGSSDHLQDPASDSVDMEPETDDSFADGSVYEDETVYYE